MGGGSMSRVLVIDDCDQFGMVVQEILTCHGYEVTRVGDADAALSLADCCDFDVILCDLVLPFASRAFGNSPDALDEVAEGPLHISAFAGLSAIRSLSSIYPHVPIVAISGALTGSPLRLTEQFGAHSALSKPCPAHILVSAIRRAQAERRQ